LSLIACCSLPICAPWVILSFAWSSRESVLARRLPRLCPTLRVWAVVIVILAIDFAVNSLCNLPHGLIIRLCVCDAVAVLLSAFHMMLFQTSPRDLWALAFCVGLAGLASIPLVVVR
jgi:hypothetical protein